MDLNQLYFDHQILLMKAQRASSSTARAGFEATASAVACRIGRVQHLLGAPAAPVWQALASPGCAATAAR